MKDLKAYLLLALVAIATQCTSAQIFYSISGEGLKSPSYLFGTHHLAPLSVIDSMGARKAFDEAVQVVGEMDMTKSPMELAMMMQSHMVAPPDSTLTKVLGSEKIARYTEIFKQMAPVPGMELAMFDGMKPMVVNAMLTLGLVRSEMPGYNPEQQLDTYFMTEGVKAGKTIVPLETAEQQASFIYDSVSIADQATALCNTFEKPDEARKMAKLMNNAYLKGNLDQLLELTKSEDSNPRFFETLLYSRNDAWMKRIPSIMAKAPAFIAVGALHLAGDRGLIEQLRKMGYTVEPIK